MRVAGLFKVILTVCLCSLAVSIVCSEPPTRDEGKQMELKDVYHLEPRLVERGEIKVVGVGEVFAMGSEGPIGVDTKGTIPALYARHAEKAYVENGVRNMVDENVNIGIEAYHRWPTFIPYPSLLYHMAGCEVSEFCDVPESLEAVVIPASRYGVIACEAPLGTKTGKPLKSVNFDALFSDLWNRSAKWRDDSGRIVINGKPVEEKGYILKMFYFWPEQVPGITEYGGAPMYKCELWFAIE